jgi:hypothetical protein
MSDLAAYLRQLDDISAAPQPATVTWANPAGITYGTALSGVQLNATASVPGTFIYTPAAGTLLNAGTGRILSVTFTPTDLINFAPATKTVTIDVLRAPLTIMAQNKSKVYGAALPALTAAYTGFVNGDTAAGLDTPVSLSTTATASSAVGSYAITASGAADANYLITHVNGTLTVTRAGLTIRADDKSKVAGAANPPLTATYTGFVNGDTAAQLDSPVLLATMATSSSPAGTYPITASGATDANYTINHVNGTLTVTPAFPVVKINFQPTGAAVPAGYLRDDGAVFGNRGNGHSYGWNVSNTSFTRDRNSTRSLDQRYDTLNHMQKAGGGRSWEIAVPNGTYRVVVVSGDADHIDSVFRLNVEGALTVSGTPTSAKRWFAGTNTVTVSDGRLTVSNGTGASNNKICFVDITPVASQFVAAAAGEEPVRLEWIQRDAAGKVTLRVDGTAGADYAVEASSDLSTWQPVAVAPNVNGTLSFDDPGGQNHAQRFYRVRLNR